MRYLGGKSKLAGKFAHILNESVQRTGGRYWEPFVGGLNVPPHIKGTYVMYLSELREGVVNLYNAVRAGWDPPSEVSKEDHAKARGGTDPRSVFIRIGCSFGGILDGGYASGGGRNYAAEARRGLLKKISKLPEHAQIACLDFMTCELPGQPFTVYCDPPYRGTTGYGSKWDPDAFDRRCELLTIFSGSEVYVSEFEAPPHWEVVWRHVRKQDLRKKEGAIPVTEKLFKVVPRA